MAKMSSWMRGLVAMLLGLVVLGGVSVGGGVGGVSADEPPEREPQGAVELGLSALRLRMLAKLKEAELLTKEGRTAEALTATRDVDRLYREGMADLLRLIGQAGPAPAQPAAPSPPIRVRIPVAPPVQPAPPAPDAPPGPPPPPRLVEPEEDVVEEPVPGAPPFVSAFRGRYTKRNVAPDSGGRFGQDACLHALRWLAAHQSPDGGWEAAGFTRWCEGKPNAGQQPDGSGKATYDVGVTGLALCAFLAVGYTNRGDHEFARVIGRGLAYLRNVQDPEGCFGPRSSQHYIYNHMIAALALVEAYGMTDSALLKAPAQRALDFIALTRNPYFGWRYGVKPGDNDTSVTAAAVMALHSARLVNQADARTGRPASFRLDDQAADGARAWIEKVTDLDTGRVGYISRGSGPARPRELVDRFPGEKSESMTAAAILMRMFLGEDPSKSEPIRKGSDLIRRLPPVWNPNDGSIDMYYWYYGMLAAFQVGGDTWQTWESALTRQIVPNQRMDGNYCAFKGSWDPLGPWGPDGGRVYSTAAMALCCAVRQRYERVAGTK
jgi:hypothetical protein